MWKFIKMLLCAMVFGLFVTQLSASVPGKITVAQEQTYQGSDQGVPVQVALINYAIEQKNSKIENPDYLLPWANDGAKTLVMLILNNQIYFQEYSISWCHITKNRYELELKLTKHYGNNQQSFMDLHHDFG